MNRYLIFRTDRIGDFFISAILIKCIKKNDPSSNITIIASKKNYEYIKKFSYVDNVYKLENNIIDKVKLIFKLKNTKFKNIIIHDFKSRSKFVSLFLKKDNRYIIDRPEKFTQIEIIEFILRKMNFQLDQSALNIFDDLNSDMIKNEGYTQFHFDEKWIFNDYIKNYINIEPTKDELIDFINNILKKSKII